MEKCRYKRVPFSLKQAMLITDHKVAGYIETESGAKARIICFNMKFGPRSNMVVLIDAGDYECEKLYGMDGKLVGDEDFRFDLCIKLPITPDFVPEDNTNSQSHQFKPFEKVLVRDRDTNEWECNLFSRIDEEGLYYCVSSWWMQCIPYEGNEHLLGTTNNPEQQ